MHTLHFTHIVMSDFDVSQLQLTAMAIYNIFNAHPRSCLGASIYHLNRSDTNSDYLPRWVRCDAHWTKFSDSLPWWVRSVAGWTKFMI